MNYARWAAEHGDILYMNTPESLTIILNSAQAAIDLLEKRSSNYSDRPDFTMTKLSGWDFSIVLMRHSERWRTHRRMFHQWFQLRAVSAYYPV
ncbi:hypothetical protein DFS33DRAFT_1382037 [Desarmillaria ectypa]|nr:hypothetical protein DFS33DRAFT_1382037 [Desarmillaria ectypa]